MLDVSYNYLQVAASLAVALMSGFTGLSLTHGISSLKLETRKARIAMAAIALGGGIWAMHFIAMLGIQLPIYFFYDTLTTLSSALVGVLCVGAALLVLHFLPRTTPMKAIAGGLIATGILSSHYVGMSGMRLCTPVYSPWGVVLAILGAAAMSLAVVWAAYSQRTQKNVLLGTLVFGGAVFATHFLAMAGTGFVAAPTTAPIGVPIDNAVLAIAVVLASFVICGSFLLMSVRLLPTLEAEAAPEAPSPEMDAPEALAHSSAPVSETTSPQAADETLAIPFETQGRTHFVDQSDIAAVRAEGRYTILFVGDQRLFCPWSISDMVKRLPPGRFIQTHRSYLINPAFVSRFERGKDNGYCYFDSVLSLEKAPVSRGRLSLVLERLKIS